jgi:hypothetical protein
MTSIVGQRISHINRSLERSGCEVVWFCQVLKVSKVSLISTMQQVYGQEMRSVGQRGKMIKNLEVVISSQI